MIRLFASVIVVLAAVTSCGDAEAADLIGTIISSNPQNSLCVFKDKDKTIVVKNGYMFDGKRVTAVSRRFCFVGNKKYRVGNLTLAPVKKETK